MRKASLAVVGCGYWGKNYVRELRQMGVLGMVCDTTVAGRQQAHLLAPGIPVVSVFDEVLCSEVDGLVIATPAGTHHALTRQALIAGKDVLVEKPMALEYAAGAELVAQAEICGRVLMVGHILEYHPGFELLLDMVRHGELGRLHYVQSSHLNLGRVRAEENVLWSVAPHGIGLILRVADAMPLEVSAVGCCSTPGGIANVAVMQLSFQGGLRAHVHASWLHPFKERRLIVTGARKVVCFDDVDNSLTIYDQQVRMAGGRPAILQTGIETRNFADAKPLRRECEAFLSAISTRTAPLTDGRSALQVLHVLQTAQEKMDAENSRTWGQATGRCNAVSGHRPGL